MLFLHSFSRANERPTSSTKVSSHTPSVAWIREHAGQRLFRMSVRIRQLCLRFQHDSGNRRQDQKRSTKCTEIGNHFHSPKFTVRRPQPGSRVDVLREFKSETLNSVIPWTTLRVSSWKIVGTGMSPDLRIRFRICGDSASARPAE